MLKSELSSHKKTWKNLKKKYYYVKETYLIRLRVIDYIDKSYI